MKRIIISLLILTLFILSCDKEKEKEVPVPSCNVESNMGGRGGLVCYMSNRYFHVTGSNVYFSFSGINGYPYLQTSRNDGFEFEGDFQLMKNDPTGIYFYQSYDSIPTHWSNGPNGPSEGGIFMNLSIENEGPYEIGDNVNVSFSISRYSSLYCNSLGKIAVRLQ